MRQRALVLIADDDRNACDVLDVRLIQSGFEVIRAGDGISAMHLFDRRQPDAAVLDVKMPGADGFAVCQHIRASGSQIPVFMLTGADESMIRNHMLELTATVQGDRFVTKPYDGKILVKMIDDALLYPQRTI